MPALVLPKFPDDSGHRCVRPSMAERETVCISASQADSGSPMQGEGERFLSRQKVGCEFQDSQNVNCP